VPETNIEAVLPDIVSVAEVAERLHVGHQTVSQWRLRGVLPDPEWVFGRQPVWLWSTIARWATETGRLSA
jgi:hypothetical protein